MVEKHGFIAAIRRNMNYPPLRGAIHDYEFGGGHPRGEGSHRDRPADRGDSAHGFRKNILKWRSAQDRFVVGHCVSEYRMRGCAA